ncbi:MAG: Mur ligase family protein [Minisyncoccia bacterium]
MPLDWLIKNLIIFKAKRKIQKFKNLKIIGITGSYGKTSFKEILATILSVKYKVVFTPENKNTPLGISNVILKNLNENTEIFVVEMSAWQKGDIKTLCQITPPDIALITGINESHLERFKTIENTIKTKFEIVKYSKPNALIVLNADNNLIVENYKNYLGNKQVIFYGKENTSFLNYKITNIIFEEERFKQKCTIEFEKEKKEIEIPLLGDYAISTIIGAFLIAKHLGLNDKDIKLGISLIKPIAHRLEPIKKENFLIIDDSYNGNPNGAKAAIEVLKKFKNKRKIYVTPGLVEMGKEAQKVHEEIGRLLAPVADLVILIQNSVTGFIISGLLEKNFNREKIIIFNNPFELQEKMKEIIKPNDVILFQNDWPDNYF